MNAATMTKDQRSVLLYLETCMVDGNGFAEGRRLNIGDMQAIEQFKAVGLIEFGRLPVQVIRRAGKAASGLAHITHWVRFTDWAWQLAHEIRKERGSKKRDASNSIIQGIWDEYLRHKVKEAVTC